jgi:predicted secreted protein
MLYEVPPLAKGLRLAERLNGEDPQVEADEEEEVDNGPGHVRNVLHKRRAGLKKKLKTLTSPPTKRKTREREDGGHPVIQSHSSQISYGGGVPEGIHLGTFVLV